MERSVLEVETPILSAAAATDPNLESFRIAHQRVGYLQTSPEFAMKRLLASGSGDIFQICKCFRVDESGSRHNSEFTMLEWYRVGFDLNALVKEIGELMTCVLGTSGYQVKTYKQAFEFSLGIDPFSASLDELNEAARQHTSFEGEPLERDACLDLLISQCVEPQLGVEEPCFVTDYPASQASLARIEMDEFGNRVGKRAELYIEGVEIANAYDELTDAEEQRCRFEEDNLERERLGLGRVPVDTYLLDALASGIPKCAGVALGLDRLLMLQQDVKSIQQTLSFSDDRA